MLHGQGGWQRISAEGVEGEQGARRGVGAHETPRNVGGHQQTWWEWEHSAAVGGARGRGPRAGKQPWLCPRAAPGEHVTRQQDLSFVSSRRGWNYSPKCNRSTAPVSQSFFHLIRLSKQTQLKMRNSSACSTVPQRCRPPPRRGGSSSPWLCSSHTPWSAPPGCGHVTRPLCVSSLKDGVMTAPTFSRLCQALATQAPPAQHPLRPGELMTPPPWAQCQ